MPLKINPQSDTTGIRVEAVPSGCWIKERDRSTEIGSTLRTGTGLSLFAFAVLWNAGAAVVLWTPAAAWVNALFTATVDPDLIFHTLVFAPLLIMSIGFSYVCALNAFGILVVIVDSEHTSVYRGVGRFGWTRRVETPFVGSVRLKDLTVDPGEGPYLCIEIVYFTPIRFGGMLPDDRKKWVCVAVDAAIRARSGNVRPGNAYR